MNSLKKSIFKLFALCLMLGGLWLLSSETTAYANEACYNSYTACHDNCDAIQDPIQSEECHRTCLFPYANCVNQAEMDKEGQIVGDYPEGQAMPIIADFRMCMSNCFNCPLILYQQDYEAYEACMENRIACKISCIESF